MPRPIYFMFLASVVNRMGSFILPFMSLIFTQKIGLSKSDAGALATVAMTAQAPFMLLGGKLSDSFGNRKIIVYFDTLGALCYLACAFLRPGSAVIVLMIAASCFYATASPAFTAIVAELVPAADMKRAYSLLYLGFNLGLTVGPAFGGLLFPSYLGLMFFLDGFTTLLSTACIFVFVRGNPSRRGAEERAAADTPITAAPVSASAVSASADSKLPGDAKRSLLSVLFRRPVLLFFSGALLIYNFCYIQWSFLLPLQTAAIFSRGVMLYSLLASLNAVTVIVLTPFLTSLTQKMSAIRASVIGGALYFASFALFSVNRFPPVFLMGIVVMTLGEIMISIHSNDFIARRTPPSHLGRMNSLLSIVNGTGYACGPAVMGGILMAIGYRQAWLITAAVMLCGLAVMHAGSRFDKA